jgi:hypothetical protein
MTKIVKQLWSATLQCLMSLAAVGIAGDDLPKNTDFD